MNISSRVLLLVAVSLQAPAVLGEKVTVHLVLRDEALGMSQLSGLLLAEPDDPSGGVPASDWKIPAIPWVGDLDLDPAFRWRLTSSLAGFWAAEVSIQFTGEPEFAILRHFQTGHLAGRLQSPAGAPLPQVVSLRFQSTPRIDQRALLIPIPSTTLECPVDEEGYWSCEVPSGELDVKLRIGDFIPHYLWDVELKARKTVDLGILELERGSSLTGWVEISEEREGSDDESVTLVLKSQVMGWHGNPRERERIEARSRQITANDRGFFQFRGVPPGGYVLRATRPGFAAAEVSSVDISENREIVIEDAMTLHPPATLEVYIDPPVDPWGSPWVGVLANQRRRSTVMQTQAEKAASLEGYWTEGDIGLGTYRLRIRDIHGSFWLHHDFDVTTSAPSPLFLEIPVIPIEGRLSMGDEPMQVSLAFGSTQGRQQIRIRSNEDGEFEGYLPHEGQWPVDIFYDDNPDAMTQAIDPVKVEIAQGKSVAVVDIELPNTRLKGEVLSGGQPLSGAFVAIMRKDAGDRPSRRDAVLTAGAGGTFEVLGLSPGNIMVKAYSGHLSTSYIPVQLQEDLEAPSLRLYLEKKIELSGQVFTPSGSVVPGAQVTGVPTLTDPSQQDATSRTITTMDGSFTLQLPATSRGADLIVVPPGFATKIFYVHIISDRPEPVLIQVEPIGGNLLIGLEGGADSASRSELNIDKMTVSHNGSTLPLRFFLGIFMRTEKMSVLEKGLLLSDLGSGEYSLCDPDGCDTGSLQPYGELTLHTAPNQKP